MRRSGDAAVSAVLGGLLVFTLLGLSIVYVNAVYVPRQGVNMEIAAREDAEAALEKLGVDVSQAVPGPVLADLPLRADRPAPPLLAGIVLTPTRVAGAFALDPAGANVTISHVTRGGAPADDPMRESLGGGYVRVWSLGSEAGGAPVGSATLAVGGAYLDAATYRFEAGAVLLQRGGASGVVAPPALHVARGGSASAPTTTVAWRVPVLAGDAGEVAGGSAARLSLAPGLVAESGGGAPVFNVTITVETRAVTAWRAALEQLVGADGVVTVAQSGPPDNGTVTALILPPPGSPANQPRVTLDLSLVRFDAEFTGRTGG